MSQALLAMMGAGTNAVPTYEDDVFSAYTYTGNGSTQTITNGIDLAGQGGMVWIKDRSVARSNKLTDTARGTANGALSSELTVVAGGVTQYITSFDATGFSMQYYDGIANNSGETYISWTFRKAARFFDIQTYTGNGANRTISHNLGQVPGMIIVKRTDTTGSWMVYHNALANTENLVLNTTDAKATNATAWNSTTATSSVFSLGTHADVNTNDGTYVAYLFGHDTGADGLIQCGSFTVSSGTGTTEVNLGWEPQFLLTKYNFPAYNWNIYDASRGWTATTTGGNVNARLSPNISDAEATDKSFQPSATGFRMVNSEVYPGSPVTIVYLAIRRPNKPPTVGTQVYNAIARTGTGAAATVTGVGFAPDVCWAANRNSASESGRWDRLRGAMKGIRFNTDPEYSATAGGLTSFGMDGCTYGNASEQLNSNTNGYTYINWFFKRAPGVFDVVCYTGTGSAHTESHNLGVAPELIIFKRRSEAGSWWAMNAPAGSPNNYMTLGATTAVQTDGAGLMNSTPPTASVLTVGTSSGTNAAASTYVCYLFATKAGISKVGSYTGNGGTAGSAGTSQTINCGFTTGSRFVMLKCTSHTSGWVCVDTVRGLIAGNDPAISMNTTAEEVTTTDLLDPDVSGFVVNQLATGTTSADFNVTGRTYIFLSFA